jgi:hypothetical protein
MKALARRETLALLIGALCIALPHRGAAQTFVLDPSSTSLTPAGATSGDLLAPNGFKIPAAGLPVKGYTAAQFGLLPGDVIDAISFGNEATPGNTLTFSVSRSSTGLAGGTKTPDVRSEATAVPAGVQSDASGSLFSAADPACAVGVGLNTQIADGNGAGVAGPPLTCYPTLGLGLAELRPTPGPPFNDGISDVEWSVPGAGLNIGIGFSLAAGSPTLTPGNNPLLPGGAEPGDVIVSFPVSAPFPGALGVFVDPSALGLISGGPGCAPPACDDIDALAVAPSGSGYVFMFSLAPGSPSLGACGYSPADVLGGIPPLPACAPPILTAGAIGLATTDNVTALESYANACPVTPGSGSDPDGDGIGVCDSCPTVFNPAQTDDYDGDAVADACDPCTDSDGDGLGNRGFPNTCPVDLCPFVAGPNTDSDGDGIGDVCDNCPSVANPSQADADNDQIGDACDICPSGPDAPDSDGDSIPDACDPCSGGVGMLKAQVKVAKLLSGPNAMQIQAQGNLTFPGATLPVPPLDVINPAKGMRVRVDDLGNNNAVLFDYTVPGGGVPQCGPKDGWKSNGASTSQKYLNKTNQDPTTACAAGSAKGVTNAAAQDKTASSKGATFKLKGKNGTYGPAIGPVRLTVVLGGAAEGAAGQCGVFTFPAANCSLSGGGKTLKCKQ